MGRRGGSRLFPSARLPGEAGNGTAPVGYAALRSDVQWPHFFAWIGIVDRQCGQSFVVGTASGASSFFLRLLMPRTTKKMANAMMRKFTIVFTNIPQFRVNAPA